MERCQTVTRQLGEWIPADGRIEKSGHGQMEESMTICPNPALRVKEVNAVCGQLAE